MAFHFITTPESKGTVFSMTKLTGKDYQERTEKPYSQIPIPEYYDMIFSVPGNKEFQTIISMTIDVTAVIKLLLEARLKSCFEMQSSPKQFVALKHCMSA